MDLLSAKTNIGQDKSRVTKHTAEGPATRQQSSHFAMPGMKKYVRDSHVPRNTLNTDACAPSPPPPTSPHMFIASEYLSVFVCTIGVIRGHTATVDAMHTSTRRYACTSVYTQVINNVINYHVCCSCIKQEREGEAGGREGGGHEKRVTGGEGGRGGRQKQRETETVRWGRWKGEKR